jgi:hypothetical protein
MDGDPGEARVHGLFFPISFYIHCHVRGTRLWELQITPSGRRLRDLGEPLTANSVLRCKQGKVGGLLRAGPR